MDIQSLIPLAHAATEAAAEAKETGIVGMFGIDIKLFIAQLINFGIVLLILWKWVFTPLAHRLEARTKRIEQALRDAAQAEKQKTEFGHWKEVELRNTRKQAAEILQKSQEDAEEIRAALIAEAKEEQARIVDETHRELEQERQQAVEQARSEIADLVVRATERVLREKIDPKKDQKLIEEAIKNLR